MEKLLAALGHTERLAIVDHLIVHGPVTQGELQRALGFQKGTVSKWTTSLEDAGVIERDSVGAPFRLVDKELLCSILERAAEYSVREDAREIARLTAEVHEKRGRGKRYADAAADDEAISNRRKLKAVDS
jgi:DNA-binding transcriptional ArsR family regulator